MRIFQNKWKISSSHGFKKGYKTQAWWVHRNHTWVHHNETWPQSSFWAPRSNFSHPTTTRNLQTLECRYSETFHAMNRKIYFPTPYQGLLPLLLQDFWWTAHPFYSGYIQAPCPEIQTTQSQKHTVEVQRLGGSVFNISTFMTPSGYRAVPIQFHSSSQGFSPILN